MTRVGDEKIGRARPALFAMLLSGLAVVGESVLGVKLPGEHLAGVEQDTVILAPIPHRIAAGFVAPILEIENAILQRLLQLLRECRVLPKAIQHPKQTDQIKIAAIATMVDAVNRFEYHFLLDLVPSVQCHFGDFAEHVLFAMKRIVQRFVLALCEVAIRCGRKTIPGDPAAQFARDVHVDFIVFARVRHQHHIVHAIGKRESVTHDRDCARFRVLVAFRIDAARWTLHSDRNRDILWEIIGPMYFDLVVEYE